MKCPYCGEEMQAGKVCSRCGKGAGASQGIDIQYKDFKGSEMLDIRLPSRTTKPEAAPEDPGEPLEETSAAEQSSGRKRSRLIVISSIIAFVAVIVFILLRFLVKR